MSDDYLYVPLPESPVVRKCRACKQPVRGHNGPYGLNKCKNDAEVVRRRKDCEDHMKAKPKKSCKIEANEKIIKIYK